jgi:hypothetical protein
MGPEPEFDVARLPARGGVAALVPFHVSAITAPDEARRFVAVVSGERAVLGAIKFERNTLACAHFIAKIFNGSNEPLSCTIAGWSDGKMTSVAPGQFWMNPQSVAQISIRVPLRLPRPLRSLSLHMQTQSVRATAEADVPTPPIVRAAQAIAAAGILLLACVLAWSGLRPQIEAYALPAHVAAGDVVTGSYAVSGLGSARYDVTLDQTHVASGSLQDRSGSFWFPTRRRAGDYHVLLSMNGLLGVVRRDLVVSTIPAAIARTASIVALQPEPSVVRSGEKIDVRYIAHARSGTVTLFDASGIPLSRAPYDASGLSTLTAPHVDTATQYRVALAIEQGGSSAQASAGLLVLPKTGANPTANPTPIPGILTAAQVFRVVPSFVRSGARFSVRVLAHPRNFRLAIEDERGVDVEQAKIKPREHIVRFAAPSVDQDTPYVIVATFSRGNIEQTLLQPLIVHATRPGG